MRPLAPQIEIAQGALQQRNPQLLQQPAAESG